MLRLSRNLGATCLSASAIRQRQAAAAKLEKTVKPHCRTPDCLLLYRQSSREIWRYVTIASRGKRGRAHYPLAVVVLDFSNPEFFAALLFSALRFLVAVLSDLSGCSCVLKELFSKLLRRCGDSCSPNRSFLFIADPTYAINGRNTLRGAAACEIGDRFKTQRKVYLRG